MGKQHNRRIYAGYYKKYNGTIIYVIAVAKDADTGRDVIIFHEGYYTSSKLQAITKESFCEMVEIDGEYVDKFVRQTQTKITAGHIASLENLNLNGPVRHKVKDDNLDVYKTRPLRSSSDYISYAKDLCKNYRMDMLKRKLSAEQKRYIGVKNQKEYNVLKEDTKYLNDCFKTILSSHAAFFRERYIEGKSIRKYAEEHGINRGSVEHMNKKLITDLASALKSRDEADGVYRLKK